MRRTRPSLSPNVRYVVVRDPPASFATSVSEVFRTPKLTKHCNAASTSSAGTGWDGERVDMPLLSHWYGKTNSYRRVIRRCPLRGSTLTAAVDALDPELDDERIVDLTTNWLYANPLLYTLTYTLVFLRQASVPGIAEIRDRDGRGPTVRSPHVRNVATMSCFGIWFRHGYRSARGQQAIDRVNAVHARFPINQDQYRYVLATQIFEPERLLTLVGAQPLTATENQA